MESKCKEIQKQIHPFIEGKTDSKETLAFIKHVKKCPDCMEELSIEFLVYEGLHRLDSASAFDLNKELADKINKAEEKAKSAIFSSVVFMIFAVLVAIFAGYLISTLFYY